MVIAFDFDGTLTNKKIQHICKKFSESGNEVWVVTMRKDNDFNRSIMKDVLFNSRVPVSNVIFCDEKPKIEFIKSISADIYIDNVSYEFESILNQTNTLPLLCSL